MKSIRFLLLVTNFLFVAGFAQAQSWLKSPTLPEEVRTLFEEAPEEIEIRELPTMPKSEITKKFWLDNHRIIFTTRNFNGWIAGPEELSKIVIYNVDTGVSEETPYRGNLWCFGADKEMLIHDYPERFPNFIRREDSWEQKNYFLKGKFGETLKRILRKKDEGHINNFSCEPYNNHQHDYGPQTVVKPLQGDDGILLETIADFNQKINATVKLLDSTGAERWSVGTRSCNYFDPDPKYLPWLNAYFSGTAFADSSARCSDFNKKSWVFSTSSIEVKSLPRLVQEALRRGGLVGYGSTYWARAGLYFNVDRSAYKLLDGLYWHDEKSGISKRILKKPWGLDNLSPNGCRSLVMVSTTVVIDLCKGKNYE